MRTALLILLATALSAVAQRNPTQPAPSAPNSNWQRVEALHVGTPIEVKTKAGHAKCKLASVTADALTCTQGSELTFQRMEILKIETSHRTRSALIGLGAGSFVGSLPGAVAGPYGSGKVIGEGAVGFGGAGAAVGYFTNFTGSTIYRAP